MWRLGLGIGNSKSSGKKAGPESGSTGAYFRCHNTFHCQEGALNSSHVRGASGCSPLLLSPYQIPLHSHNTLFLHVTIIKRKPLLPPLLSLLILFHLLLQVLFLETKSYTPKREAAVSNRSNTSNTKQYLPRSWSYVIDLPIKAKSENEICS